jgi:predicted lipid-binding transport protein (Tim44 family)
MKDQLRQFWREASLRTERDTADALNLPLEEFFEATVTLLGFIGATLGGLVGLLIGMAIGALAESLVGGVIGFLLGVMVNLLILALLALIPSPFAWLVRRPGYAQ